LKDAFGAVNRFAHLRLHEFQAYLRSGFSEDFMGYGVELSSRTTSVGKGAVKANSKGDAKPAAKIGGRSLKASPKKKTKGRRGLDRNEILDAAFAMLAGEGEAGFSVRKLAGQIGVDPMTVLHHFQSRNALLRSIADRALSVVELPLPSGDWRKDLLAVANAYRGMARRYPKVFHLHFRFNATGPADHASSEVVYRAMRATGLSDPVAAGLGLAFYAFVLGFALAETEGLLVPLSASEEEELLGLDPLGYPATRAFIPAFKKLDADAAFNNAFAAFVTGVAARAKG
jgi:AcrR family transcriptional regulator